MARSRRLVAWALAAMALLILASRALTFTEPFDRDIATSILFGRELAAGARMYVDLVEFKPPGAFVVWQVVHQLVGTSTTAVGATNVLFSVLTLVAVYWAGTALLGSRIGGLHAAAFWTLIGGELFLQANLPNLEVFMNAGLAWGAAILVTADVRHATWRRYVLAGSLWSFATLQKHHVLVVVAAVGLAWLIGAWWCGGEREIRAKAVVGCLVVAATITIVWAAVAGYFAIQGRFEPFFDQLVRYASYYGGTRGGTSETDPGAMAIVGNLREGLALSQLFPRVMLFLLPLVALSVIGLGRALWVRAARPAGLLMIGWSFGTFVVVAAPGTFYPHYYQLWLPLLAVGGGWGMATLYHAFGAPKLVAALTALVLTSVAVEIVPQWLKSPDAASIDKYGSTFVAARDLGVELQSLLHPAETFYVWGVEPSLYYYADRRPASGIMWVHRLVYGPFQRVWSEHVLEDLTRNQPILFVVQLPMEGRADHPILAWVGEHYVPARRFERVRTFIGYVRKGSRLEAELAAPTPSPAHIAAIPRAAALAPAALPSPR